LSNHVLHFRNKKNRELKKKGSISRRIKRAFAKRPTCPTFTPGGPDTGILSLQGKKIAKKVREENT